MNIPFASAKSAASIQDLRQIPGVTGELEIRLATTGEEGVTAMPGSEDQCTPDSEDQCARCSFCNKGEDEVGELVEGPTWLGRIPACICADCVELCAAILEHRRMLRDAGQDPDASQKMVAEKIDQILSVLTSLQSQVIRLRYGLSDGFTHSLDEVAGRLGISPARVREIEIEVIEFLQSSKPQDEPR